MLLREIVSQEVKSIIVPELRRLGFKGTFPHYKRMFETGKVDYLSFQFNKYGGSFIIELAMAYPGKGSEENFYILGLNSTGGYEKVKLRKHQRTFANQTRDWRMVCF